MTVCSLVSQAILASSRRGSSCKHAVCVIICMSQHGFLWIPNSNAEQPIPKIREIKLRGPQALPRKASSWFGPLALSFCLQFTHLQGTVMHCLIVNSILARRPLPQHLLRRSMPMQGRGWTLQQRALENLIEGSLGEERAQLEIVVEPMATSLLRAIRPRTFLR